VREGVVGGKGGDGGKWGEMTQTLYAHMNKIKITKKERITRGQSPVAHACNPGYLGGRYQEDTV
jgi:hypothetical protein